MSRLRPCRRWCGRWLERGAHGRQKYCRACRVPARLEVAREQSRRYYQSHRDEVLVYKRTYYRAKCDAAREGAA